MNVISDIYQADNSDESSSLLLHKDINTHIYGGGNVSHLLNVNIYPPTNNDMSNDMVNDITNQIRQQVFDKINNIPIMFVIQNTQVVVTWRSNTVSNYYHADVMGIYGDIAIKLHTERLLKMIDIATYGDCFGQTRLDFMVTKPLVRTIPLLPSEVNMIS